MRDEVDDLADRGNPGAATSATRSQGTAPAGRTALAERTSQVDDHIPAEEMTTIIPIDEFGPIDGPDYDVTEDSYAWSSRSWDDYYRPSPQYPSTPQRPSIAETTQDILIPEGEFDAYTDYDEAFDFSGAEIDDFSVDERGRADLALDRSGEIDLRSITTDDEDEAPAFRTNRSRSTRKRGGKHRIAPPPTALRGGRAALIAMAAGAAVAAVAATGTAEQVTVEPTAANSEVPPPPGAPIPPETGPGVADSGAAADLGSFVDQLAVGQAAADAEAAAIAEASRPMFVSPLPMGTYNLTSAYANRWGAFHGGIDMAAPLGTPIQSITDGVVVKAEPASGYGNWIQIKDADGNITMYGHMSASGVLVSEGDVVTAGDQIALVGNEGFSTGPHVHVERWVNGMKVDPTPWLAQVGVRLSGLTG